MNLLKDSRTSWKHISILIILAFIAGGWILIYSRSVIKEISSLDKFLEIKKLENTIPPEKSPEKNIPPEEKIIDNEATEMMEIKEFKEPLVLIFIDSAIRQNRELYIKVERYANDVRNGLNVLTEIKVANKIEIVKNILKDYYKKGPLVGAVLIGDVPIPPTTLTSFSDSFPSVYPYAELNGKEGEDIWVGVIKPPLEGEEGLELLKKYFEKNHRYHTGELLYKRKVLISSYLEELQTEADIDNMEKWVERTGRYPLKDALLLPFSEYNTPEKWTKDYLAKIEERLEIAQENSHGMPTYYGGDCETSFVDFMDVKKIQRSPLFLDLRSCLGGRMTVENYIAGWHLFSGNTLAVFANTEAVFSSAGFGWGENECGYILTFAGGAPLGKSIFSSSVYFGDASVLLGDPSITLSFVKPKQGQIFSPDLGLIVIERIKTGHIVSADFNNDKKLDLLIQNTLYINKGLNKYFPFQKKIINIYGERPYVVDFDKDGDMDVITAGDKITFFINDDRGNFKKYKEVKTSQKTVAVATEDFDKDRDIDIFATTENGKILLFTNKGKNFAEKQIGQTNPAPYGITCADYDNDKDKDCTVGDKYGDLSFFENNNGNFNIKFVKEIADWAWLWGLTSGDFNKDGNIDLLLSGAIAGKYKLFINDGRGNFSDKGSIISYTDSSNSAYGLSAGDFDNDGDIDAIIAHDNGIYFKENHLIGD